jgi:hypothetical protein
METAMENELEVKVEKPLNRYFSRKFVLTIVVMLLSVGAPLLYKTNGVSDSITLSVIALLGGIGVAYGFINVKDAKLDKESKSE